MGWNWPKLNNWPASQSTLTRLRSVFPGEGDVVVAPGGVHGGGGEEDAEQQHEEAAG